MKYSELWVEKYRPTKISDIILDKSVKTPFQNYVDSGYIPNLILHSRHSGTGKTTIARALIDELDLEVLSINGSVDGTLDTLRNEFTTFVKSMSLNNKKKVIFIDEGDKLSTALQEGLRGFFEEYSDHVRFIITCNNVERITNAIKSRCVVYEVSSTDQQTVDDAVIMVQKVLEIEGRTVIQADIEKFVRRTYPDLRRALNALQTDSDNVTTTITDFVKRDIITLVKRSRFKDYHAWVNSTIFSKIDAESFYTDFKDYYISLDNPAQQTAMMLIKIHDSMYKLNFVSDPQVNVTAFLATLDVEKLL